MNNERRVIPPTHIQQHTYTQTHHGWTCVGHQRGGADAVHLQAKIPAFVDMYVCVCIQDGWMVGRWVGQRDDETEATPLPHTKIQTPVSNYVPRADAHARPLELVQRGDLRELRGHVADGRVIRLDGALLLCWGEGG